MPWACGFALRLQFGACLPFSKSLRPRSEGPEELSQFGLLGVLGLRYFEECREQPGSGLFDSLELRACDAYKDSSAPLLISLC